MKTEEIITTVFRTRLSGYDPKKIDSIQDNAWMNLCRTPFPDNKMRPHCLVLEFGVNDIFSIDPDPIWEIAVYIFSSNWQLLEFQKHYGADKIYDSIFI